MWQNFKYDAKHMYGGVKYAYTRPLHWEKDDLYLLTATAIGTSLLFMTDQETSDYFVDQRDDAPGMLREVGWYFGSPQNNYGLTSAVYVFGLVTNNEKFRKTGVLLISAASASGLIQTFSKTIAGRARPTAGGPYDFKPFSSEGGYHSFPSGHTILTFTTAYAIGKQFKNPWIKSGIYLVGLISPVSRLWEGAHWLSDVGLSIALSVAVVDSIDKYLNMDRKYGPDSKNKISWNLQFGSNKIGLIGTF